MENVSLFPMNNDREGSLFYKETLHRYTGSTVAAINHHLTCEIHDITIISISVFILYFLSFFECIHA